MLIGAIEAGGTKFILGIGNVKRGNLRKIKYSYRNARDNYGKSGGVF
jgi:hypothetical protein